MSHIQTPLPCSLNVVIVSMLVTLAATNVTSQSIVAAEQASQDTHSIESASAVAGTRFDDPTPRYGFSDFDAGRLVGRTITVTACFAAVCGLTILMIRRVRQGGSGRTSSSEMKVLETLHLAPRCALQLIQVDAQRFLVARDAHGLRSVTAVNSFAETLEALEAEPKDASTRELSTASTFGLSLENQPTSDRLTLSFAGRRNDPWQGH